MNAQKLLLEKGIKILHVNIRSLYRKIDQLSCLFSKADFLLCTETWLNCNYNSSLVNIAGMSYFRMDRSDAVSPEKDVIPTRGGGVIIYASQKWVPYITVVKSGSSITRHYESITISVEKPNNRKMTIICLYKPPTGSIDKVLDFLKIVLEDPIVIHSEIWILGDFNINFLARNTSHVISVNRFLKEHGLKQLIHDPTRLTNRGGELYRLDTNKLMFRL